MWGRLAACARPRRPAISQSAEQLGVQVHAILAGEPTESPDPEAVKLADVFHKSPLGRRAAAATTIEREFDFLMELEGLVLRGQIDLWFEDRGKTVLVDYKTDRVTAADAPSHAEHYTLQLRLYAQALDRLTGHAPDEAYIDFYGRMSPCPSICGPRYSIHPKPWCANFAKRRSASIFRCAKATIAAPARISRVCAPRGSRLRLPLLPSRLEQRQIILLLVRMLHDLFDIQIDAQARPVGYFDVAVDLAHRMRDDLLSPTAR